jgi:hypothetical protein
VHTHDAISAPMHIHTDHWLLFVCSSSSSSLLLSLCRSPFTACSMTLKDAQVTPLHVRVNAPLLMHACVIHTHMFSRASLSFVLCLSLLSPAPGLLRQGPTTEFDEFFLNGKVVRYVHLPSGVGINHAVRAHVRP